MNYKIKNRYIHLNDDKITLELLNEILSKFSNTSGETSFFYKDYEIEVENHYNCNNCKSLPSLYCEDLRKCSIDCIYLYDSNGNKTNLDYLKLINRNKKLNLKEFIKIFKIIDLKSFI